MTDAEHRAARVGKRSMSRAEEVADWWIDWIGGACVLECGGKRSATPLSRAWRHLNLGVSPQSGVTATALHDRAADRAVRADWMTAPSRSRLCYFLALVLSFSASAFARDPADEVEPRWGADMIQLLPNQTHVAGHDPAQPGLHSVGDMFPEIALPWPMAIWSPQTHTGAWFYNNLDPDFQGFRCTHEAHPWAGDYGQFSIMPEVGTVEIDSVKRASPFSHRQESVFHLCESVADNHFLASSCPVSLFCPARPVEFFLKMRKISTGT
jgi:hypothetical protein